MLRPVCKADDIKMTHIHELLILNSRLHGVTGVIQRVLPRVHEEGQTQLPRCGQNNTPFSKTLPFLQYFELNLLFFFFILYKKLKIALGCCSV